MRPPDPKTRTAPVSAEAAHAQSNHNPTSLAAPTFGYNSSIDDITLLGLPIKFARGDLRDVLCHCDAEHQVAPKVLLDRLYAAVTPDVAGKHLIHLARVRFETHRFDFDVDGPWAIVVPIIEGLTIVNYAAFDLNDPGLRRPYALLGVAVGLEAALFELQRHPQRLIRVHFDVWSWLRDGCHGCLPVKWRRFNDALANNRIPGIVFVSDDQGRNIHEQLYAATMPEVFLEEPKP